MSSNWPGVFYCAFLFAVAYLSSLFLGLWLAGFNPFSPAVLAITLGIAMANLKPPGPRYQPGIQYCLKSVLRVAIVFIGLQLSLLELGQLGALGLPVVAIAVLTGLVGVELVGRLLKLPLKLIYLVAAGTSICGVTAVVSTAPVIEADEREVAYAVANVTLFGLLGTLAYPYLVGYLFAGGKACGLFLGTAIHDTAQVMGAAASYRAMTGDEVGFATATVTKLTRNLLLALIIPYFGWRVRRDSLRQGTAEHQGPPLFPSFLLGFLAMSLVRTLGDYSLAQQGAVLGVISSATWKSLLVFWGKTVGATWLVGLALVGVGLSLKLGSFRGLGLKPFVLGFVGASLVGLSSYLTISVLVGR